MHDCAVVGGGPAGAALAIRLARAGRDVLLVERSEGAHDKVCGEFLSASALAALGGLGVDPAKLGAIPITRMAVLAGARRAGAPLPFPAASLSRHVMDEALLLRAAALGVRVRRGVIVRGAGADWIDAGEGRIAARQVAIATGKRELRGHARETQRRRWTGLKLHLRLAPAAAAAAAGRIGLHLLPGGYAGLQPVPGGFANLCLATCDPVLIRARGTEELLDVLTSIAPSLGTVLAGAEPCWPRPLAIAGVPYGYLRQARETGVFHLGDQFAVIPSFCGDGMAIALASGEAAASALLDGQPAAAYHAAFRRRLRPQFRRAALLSRAIGAAPRALVTVGALFPGLMSRAARLTRAG